MPSDALRAAEVALVPKTSVGLSAGTIPCRDRRPVNLGWHLLSSALASFWSCLQTLKCPPVCVRAAVQRSQATAKSPKSTCAGFIGFGTEALPVASDTAGSFSRSASLAVLVFTLFGRPYRTLDQMREPSKTVSRGDGAPTFRQSRRLSCARSAPNPQPVVIMAARMPVGLMGSCDRLPSMRGDCRTQGLWGCRSARHACRPAWLT